MKKIIFFSCLYLAGLANLKAQQAPANLLLLNNYTYTSKHRLVGEIHSANSVQDKSGFILKGQNAKFFHIRKNNQLFIRKNAASSDAQWFDLTVSSLTGESSYFRIVNNRFINNKVIAHRGSWKNTKSPENSIASLQHAILQGCEGSEFDVHMSVDSVLYINHDPKIQGVEIETVSSDNLSKILLSNSEVLPTLRAYLEEGLKQNRTKLILEIKSSVISKERSLALTEKVLQLVREIKAQAWITYISFDYDILKRVLEVDPFAKVAYLGGEKNPASLAADKFYGLDYNYAIFQNKVNWIKEAHANNLTVNAWTVNDPKIMDWMLANKLDFITTNEPELLLKKVGEKLADK
ncbi:MAG: Glycerophosphodiester phosphodiesterase [Mucilaginibacter sp.]|nr:Glycerophosphodiester phosphodiesterase [Mucilaginibacter sp.]